MTDLEELVSSEIEDLREREDVRAVAVVGSYAWEQDQDHNDIDILCIIEGNWRKRVTEEIDGVVVEKFFNSEEWAEHYLDEAEKKDNWAYPYRWFANPDVRYDPENVFEKLKEKAEEFKREKFEEDLDEERLLYNIWDQLKDIEREEDVGQKRYLMNKLFSYLLDNVYEINQVVPVKDNYRIKKLKEVDGYIYKLAQEFLTSSSTLEKERKLEKMVEHVTRGIGEPNPEWETEKEEFEGE